LEKAMALYRLLFDDGTTCEGDARRDGDGRRRGDATGGVQAEAGSGGTGALEQGKEMRRELWK